MRKSLSILALLILATSARAGLFTGTNATSAKLGTNTLTAIYAGTTVVWSASSTAFTNTAGMLLWLDRTNIPSGAVATWPDTLGVRNATQATASLQPTGVVCAAGGYEIATDGTDDYLSIDNVTMQTNWLAVFTLTLASTNDKAVLLGKSNAASIVPLYGSGSTGWITSWGHSARFVKYWNYNVTGRMMVGVLAQQTEGTNQLISFLRNGTIVVQSNSYVSVSDVLNTVFRRSATYSSADTRYEDIRLWGGRTMTTNDAMAIMQQINASMGDAKVW